MERHFRTLTRLLSTQARPKFRQDTSSWAMNDYTGTSGLKLVKHPMPIISHPDDVLVKVKATSLNPLDVFMSNGYGYSLLNVARSLSAPAEWCEEYKTEFPLVLGRDFCGEVVECGSNVKNPRVGDAVWGVTLPSSQGCHAEHVVVPKWLVDTKPDNLDHVSAAAIPYAAMTAHSALTITAEIHPMPSAANAKLNVLVLGASGGVGHLAVQLLKAWNCRVTSTCRGDAHDLVKRCGADKVINYQDGNIMDQLQDDRFDVILDCAAQNDTTLLGLLKPWKNSKYVTLSSPLMRNSNSYGVAFGGFMSASELIQRNVASWTKNGSTLRWAYFVPSPNALRSIKSLVESKQICPVVQEKIPYKDLLRGYQMMEKGSIRGKLVIHT